MSDNMTSKVVVVNQVWNTDDLSCFNISCTDSSRFIVSEGMLENATIQKGQAYRVEYLASCQTLLDRGDLVTVTSFQGPLTFQQAAVNTVEK